MKLDVHKHEQRYKNWKDYVLENGEDNMSQRNSEVLLNYVFDMQVGVNISKKSKKGGRSFPRLNSIRQRMAQMMRAFEKRGLKDLTELTEEKMMDYFTALRTGEIKTARQEKYKSVQDYAKVFKSFWHWWIKVNRKKGIAIIDITEDLDTSKEEQPSFVYMTKKQLYEDYMPYFDDEEQMILSFVFDSLIRSPTEILSLEVGDLFNKEGEVWVNIPDEISKVKGRLFNLMYCGSDIKNYIKRNNLKPGDKLFSFSSIYFNRKMKKIAHQIWGDKVSHPKAKGRYNEITLYSLRHSGSIHFRKLAEDHPEALGIDTLRERGGWKDYKMLNYYTSFIGLTGKIQKGKLLLKEDKDKLEMEVEDLKIWKEGIMEVMEKMLEQMTPEEKARPLALSEKYREALLISPTKSKGVKI